MTFNSSAVVFRGVLSVAFFQWLFYPGFVEQMLCYVKCGVISLD